MAYRQDLVEGINPHVNYEPSSLGGLKEAPKVHKDHMPHYNAALIRERIDRQNNFKQAGETYRNFEEWERDELISNLVNTLAPVRKDIQDKMIDLFSQCDQDYGRRVAEGLEMARKSNANMEAKSDRQAVRQAEDVAKESKPY